MKSSRHAVTSLLLITLIGQAFADNVSTNKIPLEKLQAVVQAKGCASCHGTRGQGNPAMKGPRLAGQTADALASKLRDYRNGEIKNPTMNVMAYRLSDQDIVELSGYFSRFQ
ncbi:hypothetical protein GCM10023116_14900 [Kistimonas scapharcae]|uniref:Cytochrome c domain-containing protein n=1 Tax=Kistimonas scapharcae TaxID=1036133 RepID=A0ABP8V098_9GAMM